MKEIVSYPLFEKDGEDIKVFWSGTITEYVITEEGLMKANNWSREKAKAFMKEMIEDIEREGDLE